MKTQLHAWTGPSTAATHMLDLNITENILELVAEGSQRIKVNL